MIADTMRPRCLSATGKMTPITFVSARIAHSRPGCRTNREPASGGDSSDGWPGRLVFWPSRVWGSSCCIAGSKRHRSRQVCGAAPQRGVVPCAGAGLRIDRQSSFIIIEPRSERRRPLESLGTADERAVIGTGDLRGGRLPSRARAGLEEAATEDQEQGEQFLPERRPERFL